MSKKLVDGVWVIACDWEDPETGKTCTLGEEGEPAMFVDPTGGREPANHYQCGRHHGIIPQAEQEEFQLPEGHKLNQEVLSKEAKGVEVEDIEEEDDE
jgi:hypothetical protein